IRVLVPRSGLSAGRSGKTRLAWLRKARSSGSPGCESSERGKRLLCSTVWLATDRPRTSPLFTTFTFVTYAPWVTRTGRGVLRDARRTRGRDSITRANRGALWSGVPDDGEVRGVEVVEAAFV